MELDETKRSSRCNTVSDFSVNNFRCNLKYANLKGNLSPQPQNQSKKKVSSLYKELINAVEGKRMIKVKIRKDEKSTDKLLEKAFSIRKNYISLKKIAKNTKEKKRYQENIITDLNINKAECKDYEIALKDKLNKTKKQRARSEEKTKSISSFCNETKIKSNNIPGIVDKYLNEINIKKNNNLNIKSKYEERIRKLGKFT